MHAYAYRTCLILVFFVYAVHVIRADFYDWSGATYSPYTKERVLKWLEGPVQRGVWSNPAYLKSLYVDSDCTSEDVDDLIAKLSIYPGELTKLDIVSKTLTSAQAHNIATLLRTNDIIYQLTVNLDPADTDSYLAFTEMLTDNTQLEEIMFTGALPVELARVEGEFKRVLYTRGRPFVDMKIYLSTHWDSMENLIQVMKEENTIRHIQENKKRIMARTGINMTDTVLTRPVLNVLMPILKSSVTIEQLTFNNCLIPMYAYEALASLFISDTMIKVLRVSQRNPSYMYMPYDKKRVHEMFKKALDANPNHALVELELWGDGGAIPFIRAPR